MSKYDVIVIGAGIEGSSSAYHLAKNGKRVLLLEQFPLPHIRGSSHGQSRITRYAYADEFYVRMMVDAFPMWDQLQQESGENFFLKGSEGLDQVTSSLRAHSIPHEVVPSKELTKRFPAFKPEKDVSGVFDPSGGLLHADRALSAFQKVFKQLRGTIKDACPVTSIVPGKLVKVITPSAVYAAESVVIAAGAWAGKFAKNLNLDIPLKPIKTVVFYWKADPAKLHLHQPSTMPCFTDSQYAGKGFHIYGFPAAEYPGLVKVCLHNGPPVDPDHRDNSNTDFVVDAVKEALSLFPWLADTPSIREYCMYTMTPDAHPFIDRHPDFPNVVFAAGFSGHGFKLAPAVGKAVSELVLGSPATYNMEPFRLNRFNIKANL